MGSLFFSFLQCCIYDFWITRTMKKTKYNNLVVLYCKIDSIWKTPKQTTPKIPMNFQTKQGIPCDFICAGIEHAKEVLSQSFGFRFIPHITVDNIFFNFRKKL